MRTLLLAVFSLFASLGIGQNTDPLIEKYCQQVEDIAARDGRAKALMMTDLGLKYLAPGNAALEKLRYETYYNGVDYGEGYDDSYALAFQAVCWSPDGSRIAVSLADGTIRLYNTANLAEYETIKIAEEEDTIWDVDWSPNGAFLAFATSARITGYYSFADQSIQEQWEEDDFIRTVAWSPDGERIASGGDENILFVYNIKSGKRERAFESHTDWIRSVAWSADGTTVAAASDDNTATVWSITEGNLMHTHRNHEDYCRKVVFSAKGNSLVTISDDLNVYVYENATDEIPDRNLRGHENWIWAVDWAPNNRSVATADQAGLIIVHDLKGTNQQFFNAYEEETAWSDIAFSADSKRFTVVAPNELAIYSIDNPSSVLRTSPEKVLAGAAAVVTDEGGEQLETTLRRLLPTAVGLYPDPSSDRLGVLTEDYQLQVIDQESGAELFIIDGHEDWVRNIDWSPNGQLIATASDDMMVGVWSAETGDMQHFLSGHTDWVRDVAFSPDGDVLASAGDDGIIRIWDPTTGDELAATDRVEEVFLLTVDWSTEKSYFAAQSNESSILVWDAKDNSLVHTFEAATVEGSLKWDSDETFTVVGIEGERFRWTGGDELEENEGPGAITSTSTKGAVATAQGPYINVEIDGESVFLAGHRSDIIAMEWGPDDRYLVSQSREGKMGVWEPQVSAKLVALLNLSNGLGKPLLWSKDGSGFFTTGANDKVFLPPSSLELKDKDLRATIDEYDILRYDLEATLLSNPEVVSKLQANGPAEVLTAIADFYETRAKAKGDAGKEDAAQAAAFRAAAEK